MNRKITGLIIGMGFAVGNIYAQGEIDAYNMSRTDLKGTARSIAMGGAFGALGGDASGVAINPAGIGIYTKFEVVTTMNFQNTKTETDLNAGKINDNKFKFNADNLAFVGTFNLMSDLAPTLNFGVSFNRLKSYDRKYSMAGNDLTQSLARYMTYRANMDYRISDPDKQLLLYSDGTNWNRRNPFAEYDWMAVFGYNAYLFDWQDNQDRFHTIDPILDNNISNNLYVHEKGYVDSYDFNMGTTFADVLSFGLSVAVTDIDYRREAYYSEFVGSDQSTGFALNNWLKSEGTGWQIKTGVIVKPVNELRIGLAYHSPTWYDMTDYANADMDYNMTKFNPGSEDFPSKGQLWTGDTKFDYRFRTPDKFVASIAGVFGQYAIISADYEYTNYKNSTKLFDEYGNNLPEGQNEDIKFHYRGNSTLRIGAEARITPQFSLRAGYAWMQSPVKKELKANQFPNQDEKYDIQTKGSDAHYILDGDAKHFTWGLGYRFSTNFYTDIAFMIKNQKSDLYTHTRSEKASMKTDTFRGVITFGFKFSGE